jgi:hypothetical protein
MENVGWSLFGCFVVVGQLQALAEAYERWEGDDSVGFIVLKVWRILTHWDKKSAILTHWDKNINPLKTARKDITCCEHFVSYLQGAGRVFCAGGDLKMFYGLGKSGTKKLALIFTLVLILFTSLHGTGMEPDVQGWSTWLASLQMSLGRWWCMSSIGWTTTSLRSKSPL